MEKQTFKQFLLTEAREDDIANKQSDKIMQRYRLDVQQHPGSPKNFTDALQIIKYISSNTYPKLINWTANQYLKGAFSLEDVEIIKQHLDLFNSLKAILPKKDIGQYASINDLVDTLEQYKAQAGKKQSTLNKETSIQKWVESGQAEIVYNNGGFLIVWTKTHAANCAIGSGTKWCTTSKLSRTFDEYNHEGPLYVLLTPDKQKYQFHEQSKQFMDKQDRSVISMAAGQQNILLRYPVLIPVIQNILKSDEWINESIVEDARKFTELLTRVSQGKLTNDDLILLCSYLDQQYNDNDYSWNDDLYGSMIDELKQMKVSDPNNLLLKIAKAGVKNDIGEFVFALVLTDNYKEGDYKDVADKVEEIMY